MAFASPVYATVYYLNTGTGTSGNAWTTPSAWTDENGTPATVFSAEDELVAKDGKTLKMVTGDLGCKSLTVGAADGSSGACLYMRGNSKVLNEGTFLACGVAQYSSENSGKTLTLNGKNKIVAPISKPFGLTGHSSRDNLTLNLANPYSEAGCAALVGASVYTGSIAYEAGRGFKLQIIGDASGYYGDMIVTSKYAVAATSPYFGVGLAVSTGGSFPGGIRICKGGGLVLSSATELEVGRLTLEPGSIIRTTMNVSAGTCNSVAATGSFSVSGPVYVSTGGHTPVVIGRSSPAPRCKLITAPAGTRIDKSQFVFLPDPNYEDSTTLYPQRMHFEVETVNDVDTLYLAVDPVVTLAESDPNSKWLNVFGSCLTNAAPWSDGQLPHSNAIYRIIKRFRTTFDDEDYTFPGDPIYLEGGAEFHIYGKRRFIVKDFRLRSGALWSGEGSRPVLCGGRLTLFDGGWHCVRVFNTTFTIESQIFGSTSDALWIRDMYSVGNSSQRWGDVALSATNTDFLGRIILNREHYAGGLTSPCLTLNVADERNLGGALDAFNFRAVELRDYSRLSPLNDLTLSAGYNRGLFVVTNGTVFVTNGVAMKMEWPITMFGTLHKLGGGTLELAGPLKFYDAANGAAVDETREEADVLDLHDGVVKIGNAKSCDGFKIVADGGRIVLPVNSPAGSDLAKYGLWNVKSAEPFACGDGVSKFPVEFEPTAASLGNETKTNALVTVANTALQATLDALARPTIYGSTRARFVTVPVEGEDATTILCISKRAGMVLICK